jgi:hypothetical protein
MLIMKRYIFLILIIAAFSACNSPVNQTDKTGEPEQKQEGFYGAKITDTNPISGAKLVSLLAENDSVWVTMKSTIVSNCQASGCWMDLDLGNDVAIKVTFKDYAFFIPLDSKGKTATIEGYAKKELIPVDLLKHYAEDENKSQEEIDAITEPELTYTFEAAGVIIED